MELCLSRHDAEVSSPEEHRHADKIQRVKFTEAVAHQNSRPKSFARIYLPRWTSWAQPQHSKIWGSSSGRDRVARASAREAAWKLAKNVLKSKEHERATFFSPSENKCLPAWNLQHEEREFVVDSETSMHMISKKDLSDAEMDTLTKSWSPTMVITASGEVQTQEEAIVYVKELEIFLTVKVLENTPAVLSLGKLCDENGYSYEWINGQKPHLIKTGIRIICIWIFINFEDTCETGESFFIFFILTFFTCSRRNSGSRKGRCTWQWHLSNASVWGGWW